MIVKAFEKAVEEVRSETPSVLSQSTLQAMELVLPILKAAIGYCYAPEYYWPEHWDLHEDLETAIVNAEKELEK